MWKQKPEDIMSLLQDTVSKCWHEEPSLFLTILLSYFLANTAHWAGLGV